jgi:O-antigen ligase
MSFFVIFGLSLALFALVQHFTWNGRFYWIRPVSAEVTSPFGPFVNRNHFAGYMELLIPLPLAMIITRAGSRDTRLFYLFAATMMAVAGVASLSRGGMISLSAELIFIGWLSLKNAANRRAQHERQGSKLLLFLHRSAFVLIIITALAAGIYWTGPERVLDRVARTDMVAADPQAETFFTSRGWIWRDTLAIISANPISGVGLGAYETAYPNYSTADGAAALGVSYTVDRAHNDYLQVLADGGLIGGGIVFWFIISVFRAVFRGLKSRDPLRQAFALGGGAGIFGLLVHSCFDFNLQLPSNALLFLLLAGLVAQVAAKSEARAQRKAAHVAESVTEFAVVKGVSL